MKIATLNLNGATIFPTGPNPRLPDDLFSIETIREKIIEKACYGLDKLLEKKDLDVIAIQELIYLELSN